MIFKRKDPAKERRQHAKDIAKSVGKGALVGGGLGLGYAYDKRRILPLGKRVVRLAQSRNEQRNRLDIYKHAKKIGTADKKHVEKLKRSARKIRALKKATFGSRTPRAFSKANKIKSLKNIGTGIAVGAAYAGYKKFSDIQNRKNLDRRLKKEYGILAPKVTPARIQQRGSILKNAASTAKVGGLAGATVGAMGGRNLKSAAIGSGIGAGIGAATGATTRAVGNFIRGRQNRKEIRRYSKEYSSLSRPQRAKERVKAKLRSAIYR